MSGEYRNTASVWSSIDLRHSITVWFPKSLVLRHIFFECVWKLNFFVRISDTVMLCLKFGHFCFWISATLCVWKPKTHKFDFRCLVFYIFYLSPMVYHIFCKSFDILLPLSIVHSKNIFVRSPEQKNLVGFKFGFGMVHLGTFMNDVTQLRGTGLQFCDTMFKRLSKTLILVWQRGEGGQKLSIGWPLCLAHKFIYFECL